MDSINHGTRGGYYAHRRLGSPPCDACREAINEYVKEYREKNGVKHNRLLENIRRVALRRLRERHREEYEALVAQVKSEHGLS